MMAGTSAVVTELRTPSHSGRVSGVGTPASRECLIGCTRVAASLCGRVAKLTHEVQQKAQHALPEGAARLCLRTNCPHCHTLNAT